MGIEFATKYKQGDALQTVQLPFQRAAEGPDSYITGDFVIAFARLRVDQLNASLSRRLETMKAGARDTAAGNDVLKTLALHADGFNSDGSKFAEIQNALKKAMQDVGPDSPLYARFDYILNDKASPLNIAGDQTLIKPEMDALSKDIENAIKSVDRRCQDDQLYINKEMGEKDQILQLAAMLIQSMNESVKQILGRS